MSMNNKENLRRGSSSISSVAFTNSPATFSMGNHVLINQKISTYISSLSVDEETPSSNGKVIVILKDNSKLQDKGCLYEEYRSLEEIYIKKGYTVIIPNIKSDSVNVEDIRNFLKYIRDNFPKEFISLLSADECCNNVLIAMGLEKSLIDCLYFINPIKLQLGSFNNIDSNIPVMMHFNNEKVPMSIRYVIESKLKELNFKYQLIVDNLYELLGNENIAFERVCLEQLYWFEQWANVL